MDRPAPRNNRCRKSHTTLSASRPHRPKALSMPIQTKGPSPSLTNSPGLSLPHPTSYRTIIPRILNSAMRSTNSITNHMVCSRVPKASKMRLPLSSDHTVGLTDLRPLNHPNSRRPLANLVNRDTLQQGRVKQVAILPPTLLLRPNLAPTSLDSHSPPTHNNHKVPLTLTAIRTTAALTILHT